MQPTSHFLATSLQTAVFTDLLVSLQRFCKEQRIEDCIELQNPLSLHITIYYLDAELTDYEHATIPILLNKWRSTYSNSSVRIGGHNFFFVNEQPHFCFLVPRSTCDLGMIHNECAALMPNVLPKNQFTYTPHITLFTVKDFLRYAAHSQAIEKILNEHIQVMSDIDVFANFHLYAVDSNYSPQIQIAVQ